MLREARMEDLDALPELYLFLHEDSIPDRHSEHTAFSFVKYRLCLLSYYY